MIKESCFQFAKLLLKNVNLEMICVSSKFLHYVEVKRTNDGCT
jgi:hypothetical protein